MLRGKVTTLPSREASMRANKLHVTHARLHQTFVAVKKHERATPSPRVTGAHTLGLGKGVSGSRWIFSEIRG